MGEQMKRVFSSAIYYIIILLVLVAIISLLSGGKPTVENLSTDEFFTQLEEDNITSATIQPMRGVYKVTGEMEEPTTEETPQKSLFGGNDEELPPTYVAYFSPEQSEEANKLMAESDITQTYLPEPEPSAFAQFLTNMLPFLLIFGLFFFLLNQSQGGGNKVMNFGKSKAKMFDQTKKKVVFDDVAGAEEEKQELVEIVDFLKDPAKFSSLGARIPKGVLLVGPPGTGKTLLARAVAGEAGVPFYSISGSDFVEMFVGVGASRVRDLFETAKKNAPAIIFIDEIDAVGRQRGAGLGGGHDEREQTLNQLLVEMDGFGDKESVIVIAATNRSDVLDPALLRPGRFDREILVDVPDIKGRAAILKVHSRNKPLDPNLDLKAIASRTPGFSGAELENLLNEAALLAARKNKKLIDMRDVDEATDRIIAGPAKTGKVISKKERETVAYHEAGHVIIGLTRRNADIVHKVTIVPRGRAGGYAVMLPKEDRFLMTKTELLNKITGLLGGRVAEDVVFGEVSTGAHNDFMKATQIARSMVTEYGMSEKLGPMQFGKPQGQVFLGRDFNSERNYSEHIAYQIDEEVQAIIKGCYEDAKKAINEHREQLNLIAKTLLEVETLDAEQITSLFEKGELPVREYKHDLEVEETSEETSNEEAPVKEPVEVDSDVKVNLVSRDEENVITHTVEETPEKADEAKSDDSEEK